MTAKEYLGRLETVRIQIRALAERKQFYEDLATKCTANYSLSLGKGGAAECKVSRGAGEAADKAAELQETIKLCLEIEREVEAAIASVPDQVYRSVLEYRYIACWPLSRVAREMKYDYDYMRKLHGKALRMVKVPENIQNPKR